MTKIEITGSFCSDEEEASRLCGAVESEAEERIRPTRKKPILPPGPPVKKPDPFSDVDLPADRLSPKPNPFSDVK